MTTEGEKQKGTIDNTQHTNWADGVTAWKVIHEDELISFHHHRWSVQHIRGRSEREAGTIIQYIIHGFIVASWTCSDNNLLCSMHTRRLGLKTFESIITDITTAETFCSGTKTHLVQLHLDPWNSYSIPCFYNEARKEFGILGDSMPLHYLCTFWVVSSLLTALIEVAVDQSVK